MLLGTLASIRRYPVKSMRGESLDSVAVDERGIPGDRARQLVVESGHARLGRAYRGKENQRLHLVGGVEDALEDAATHGVELGIESGEHFFDDAALSLLVDRWLDALNAHVGYAVEAERFRSNFVVSAAPGFTLSESDLTDRALRVGEVLVRVSKPIERCVAVTYHPERDEPDPRILRYVAQERDAVMGVYCEVLRAGTARSGDSVRLVER